MKKSLSIIIRTKNESKYIGEVLSSLKKQTYQGPIEIIVVDSGSTDNTLKIVKTFDCKIIEIKPENFSFGGALNTGIAQSTGEIIVNLSGHSVPENADYLSLMTEPFSNEQVAATFGRDIPWPDACPSQSRDILMHFPDTDLDGSKFSNANAAIRKSCWETIPFDEKILAAEDKLWALQIMALGYKIKYVPAARVYHSHTPSLRYIKKRAYIESKSLNALEEVKYDFNIKRAIKFIIGQTLKDISFALKKRYNPFWFFHIPLYRMSQTIGLYKGFKEGLYLNINQTRNTHFQDKDTIIEDLSKNQYEKDKKILLVVHCFLPESIGGTEIYTYKLAKGLKKRGWHVVILTAIRNTKVPRYNLFKSRYDDIDVIRINNPSELNSKYLDYVINLNIDQIYKDILQSFKPNLVHFQHTAYLSSRFPEITHKEGIPCLFTLHDYWYICFRSQLLRPNNEVCSGPSDGLFCATCSNDNLYESPLIPRFTNLNRFLHMSIFKNIKRLLPIKIKNNLKKILYMKPKQKDNIKTQNFPPPSPDLWPILEHSFRQRFMKNQLTFAEHIISPSNHLKRRYEQEGFKKIIYIPHGFEPHNKLKNINYTGKITFACISNIIQFKGTHIILNELQYVIKREKIRLLIYGRILDYQYYEELKKLANTYPETEISFMGAYNGINDLSAIIQNQNIHAIIFPSIWEENHPLVVVESLLLGIPVICSSIGGAKENIRDGVNGLIFNPLKIGDLAEKINKVIDYPLLLNKLKEGAEMTNIFTLEEHLDRVEKLYLDLLSKKAEIKSEFCKDS